MQDLEQLMQLLEKKVKDKELILILKSESKKGGKVRSLKDIETLMQQSTYQKLMKGINIC